MVLLPFDVVQLVSTFACLRQRYRWSMTCRALQFTVVDWSRYTHKYEVSSPKTLRRLVQRDYDAAWKIVPREHCLWSLQLNEPLHVWSPWTTAALCHHAASCTRMYFRECRFVHTIRQWARTFDAIGRTRYLWSFKGHDCVVATLWSNGRKCVPSVYMTRAGKILRKTNYIFSAFRMRSSHRVRALLAVRLQQGTLRLYVKELEFST